jgi:hypothetical protein
MNMTVAMVCHLIMVIPNQPTIDRAQLTQLIEGAIAAQKYHDVSFEYEGMNMLPREYERKNRNLPDGITESYSGSYTLRRDGARKMEYYMFRHDVQTAQRSQLAAKDGEISMLTQDASAKRGNVDIHPVDVKLMQRIGSYGQILLIEEVLEKLKSPSVYEFKGYETIDEQRCFVARFYMEVNPEKVTKKSISDTYWIDIERGGHVLKHEYRWGDELARQTVDVRLKAFSLPDGQSVWLVVHGQQQGHVGRENGQRIISELPIYIESYELLSASVRFNQNLGDAYFTIQPKPGDFVSDQVKGAAYEYGQYLIRASADANKRVTNAEVQMNLEAMLKDSEVLAGELKATSVAQRGSGWMYYVPWLLAIGSGCALIVIVLRRKVAS